MIDPLDLRTFPAVESLSVVPETYRQTLLAKSTECLRSAYLYQKYSGGPITHPLAGGTLLHRAIERFIQHLIDSEEPYGNPETAKDILNEVLQESTDLTVSPDRFDSLRGMMHHVAEGLAIDPAKAIFLETPVSVELSGVTVTGTIDYGELDPGRLLSLDDWKSAFYNVLRRPPEEDEDDEYVPTKEEWPGTFQLVLYAYAAATGEIDGAPFNVDVPEYRLRQYHPRQFWEDEGTMAYREAVITRETLLDWRLYLEAQVAKLAHAFQTWEFPATMGSHCALCVSSAECPIPPVVRGFRGEIRTEEDARRAAILWERATLHRAELWRMLKEYAKATGRRIRYGKDLELHWKEIRSEKLKDRVAIPGSTKKIKGREALKDAIRRTEDIGIPLDWDYHFTKSVSTRLTRRKLTPSELTEERQRNGETP